MNDPVRHMGQHMLGQCASPCLLHQSFLGASEISSSQSATQYDEKCLFDQWLVAISDDAVVKNMAETLFDGQKLSIAIDWRILRTGLL
ncbi:hypothetical protein KSF73_11930 [Burkholderiaceae bacterium DAT-1]|nr:hypothetical protein [Burkholderiaceae bacterium DAT-1]